MPESEFKHNLDTTDEMIAERRTGDELPENMLPWMKKTITSIDGFSKAVGTIVSWLTVPIFVAMFYEVIARYFFLAPTMWAYDISRMFYGALFMLGAGYALMRGVHIRADFLYRNWNVKTQANVDLILYLVLFFPGMLAFLVATVDFAALAWIRGEKGMDTAWMPHMGPIKTALPVGIIFLLIQGISEVLKCIYARKYHVWP